MRDGDIKIHTIRKTYQMKEVNLSYRLKKMSLPIKSDA